ncbi:MAG: helix-turn-helix domain-containing protein [Candidatus Sulfotelmatobacter sp.]
MNEKELNDLLLEGIRSGEIPLEVSDSVADHWLSTGTEISDAVKLRIKSNLKQRIQNAAIQQALSSAGKEVLPFGRFIESIRERAGLSRSDVAERLKKNDEYVQRVERGDVVPTQLRTPEFADLVELFQITIRAAVEMLKVGFNTLDYRNTFRASARACAGLRNDQRGEDVERALDAFARKKQRELPRKSTLPRDIEVCASKLQEELKQRGRVDLLK